MSKNILTTLLLGGVNVAAQSVGTTFNNTNSTALNHTSSDQPESATDGLSTAAYYAIYTASLCMLCSCGTIIYNYIKLNLCGGNRASSSVTPEEVDGLQGMDDLDTQDVGAGEILVPVRQIVSSSTHHTDMELDIVSLGAGADHL